VTSAAAGSVRCRLATPGSRPAGVGVIDLLADDAPALDRALAAIGIGDDRAVPVGTVRLRELGGVDRGLCARLTPTHAQLMPHAGAAILRALLAALEGAGCLPWRGGDEALAYPEAADVYEARALAAIARAASPLAVDRLLDEPRRWRDAVAHAGDEHRVRTDEGRDARLQRLIDMPTVAVVGLANIGKSTLLNALAGRAVAGVADEAGTTRDHVGAVLDLGGLVVRWLDTPGVRADAGAIESAAWSIARPLVEGADLLLLAGDASVEPPGWVVRPGQAVLRVALRADLGRAPWSHDVGVSAIRPVHEPSSGLGGLIEAVRERLLPSEDLRHPSPWRFWAPPGGRA